MAIARRMFLPFAVLALAAPGLHAQEAAEAPIPAGTYVFVPSESDEIEGRIDEAVSHMNFLIRGIAKGRLRGANEPIDRVVIEYPGDDVRISLREDEPSVVSPQSGEFVPFTRADGEVVQVKTELGPNVIDQYFRSDDGEKQMIYTLREDGTLAVESIVYSDKLEEPFRYTWVYAPQE